MDKSGDTHQELYEAIDDRRVELDLTWKELAVRAGISTTTFENVRHGRLPRKLTRRRIEDALGWTRGSINAILDGGKPALRGQAPDPRTASPEELAEALEQLREELIEEHGAERGLDLFAEDYQRLLSIRARERRKRDGQTSRDRKELPAAGPNG